MNSFLGSVSLFFKDMLGISLIAIFLENTVFSRAIGTSTVLYTARKKINVFVVGGILTLIITASSIITYFIDPLLKELKYKYYITPLVYVLIISVVYIFAILLSTKLVAKHKRTVLSIVHLSAFNCATLGALLLIFNAAELSFGGYVGFGVGTGIGFTLAAYFVDVAHERLSSAQVPNAFRGFPITLIYIGIVSLAIYGLIGHELPF